MTSAPQNGTGPGDDRAELLNQTIDENASTMTMNVYRIGPDDTRTPLRENIVISCGTRSGGTFTDAYSLGTYPLCQCPRCRKKNASR